MPLASNETAILNAVISRLKTVTENVLLGYSATGVQDRDNAPFIMVQLESLDELGRQGNKARYQFRFNISTAVKTTDNTTQELLIYACAIRQALDSDERICSQARKHSLEETQFDIAPGHGQLSFADMALTVEAIL